MVKPGRKNTLIACQFACYPALNKTLGMTAWYTQTSTEGHRRALLNLFGNNLANAGLEIATHWSPMRPKIEHWWLIFRTGRQLATRVVSDN